MSNDQHISAETKAFLAETRPMLIDGQWEAGSSGNVITSIDPSNGETFAKIHAGNRADAEKAILAARAAFDKAVWHKKAPAERAKILWRVADLIEENATLLADLETLDGGKIYGAALNGEVTMAAESFRYYAGWVTKLEGKTTTISSAGEAPFHCYTTHMPIGVVGMIAPWNGPLVMAAWKLAPALAAGCSCIIKPSEVTSLSTLVLGDLLMQAGIPAGVVNVVTGKGREVGAAIAESPLVDKISFTGSTQTGKSLLEAAKGNLKKLTLELGGKSPAIVLADADLTKTIPGVAAGIFSGAGQVCVAGSRLYVERSIYDDVIAGLVKHVGAMKVGSGFNADSDMGPLVSEGHLNSVLSFVERAEKEGATVLTGGKRIDQNGFYMKPTVLTDVKDCMEIVKEEVFGPVLVVQAFDDLDTVIEKANDSEYGLAGSVWTQDIAKAHTLIGKLQAGLTWVNCHGLPDMAIPFGGVKQSGWGRESGLEGLLQYCELKSTVINLS